MEKEMYNIKVEPLSGGICITQKLEGQDEFKIFVTPTQADLFCQLIQEAKEVLDNLE